MSYSGVGKYDVVVVGCGVAGCRYARILGEEGFKVALIDKKEENIIGVKTCGDAIGKHHFEELKMPYPSDLEVENVVEGIKIYSPDEKAVWTIKGEGFELDRHRFGQKLLREALKTGVELYDKTYALKPVVENGKVSGVYVKLENGDRKIIRGDLIVDASGVSAVLRSRLPREWPVSEPLNPQDTSVAYREIRVVEEDIEDYRYLRIYLSQDVAPGGYWWFFPKSSRRVNVGLGVKGGVGILNPRNIFYKKLIVRRDLRNSKLENSGGGIVPTRRPLDSMVAPGFIAIGDAGVTVNPVHGGGMGSSLIAATKAAEVSVEALEIGDVSLKGLWRVNKSYNLAYGAKQASLDIMRIFLQRLGDEDLNFIMHKKIITEDDLYTASYIGDLSLSVVEKALRIIRSIARPTILKKLRVLSHYMSEAKRLYLEYPESPEEFDRWRFKVRKLYDSFERELGGE